MKFDQKKKYFFILLWISACHPKPSVVKAPDITQIASKDTMNWRPLGPFGSPIPMAGSKLISPHGTGRFMCVLPSADNSDKILIGHASAGVFKTNNAGKSWDQILNLPLSTGIFKLIRFKTDNKHLLAASALDIGNSRQYGYGLLESFDDGLTWTRNSLQFDPEEYSTDQARDLAILEPKKEKSLLAITAHKIYLSNNAAMSWQLVEEYKYNLKRIVVDVNNPKNIIVCGNGVLLSVDGGYSFTDITDKINSAYGLKNHAHANYHAAFSSKFKDRLYIVAQNQMVYLIKTELPGMNEFEIVNSNFMFMNPSRLDFELQWFPNSRSEVMWLGSTRLVKSLDDGLTFTEAASPLNDVPNHIHDDVNDIHLSENGVVWVCTDGGVDYSSDGGANWRSVTDQSVNLNASILFGFDRSKDNTILAGTQDNGIIVYKNGVWKCLDMYGDGGRVAVVSDTDDFSAGFAQMNHLIKNGGQSNLLLHAGADRTGHDFRLQYVSVSNTLYIANMHLYKKQNGKYFEILSSSLETDRKIKAFWVDPNNENDIWLAKDDPTWGSVVEKKLYHTMDGGKTWVDKSKSLPILMWRSITDICINKRGEIAVTLEAFDKKGSELNKVFVSYDGGRTFSNCSNGLPNLPVNTICYVGGRWICGTNDGVYIYNKKTWTALGNQLPKVIVTELHYYERDGMLLASTFGRGLWAIAIR